MSSRILMGDTALARAYQEFIQATADAVAKGRRLQAQLNSASAGSDWDNLATELGLPKPADTSPTNTLAQDAWTIQGNAMEHVDHDAVKELSRLDQGG